MNKRSQEPPRSIIVVGSFRFPVDDASSRRVLALARLIESTGVRVHIGSADPTPDQFPRDYPESDIQTTHLSEFPQSKSPRLLKALRQFVWGGRTCNWLATLHPKPSALLLYGGYAPFSLWLLRFQRKTGVPIIVDAVEWYQPSHLPGGRLGPFHLNVEWALRRLFPRMRNIICISRYLQRHFEAKGCRTLYLPAVLDVAAITPSLETPPEGAPLRLVYTGTPGKKDLLDPIIEALLQLDPEGSRIRFAIVGPSPEHLLGLPVFQCRRLSHLPTCIEAPGYVTNAEALAQVRRADFSVLLRYRQRYAMAGFPTKVPESLAVGTPIICNLTSDLGDFLEDGLHALVCPEPTSEACARTLERALTLTPEQRTSMRKASRNLAETRLDYRHYQESMKGFLCALDSPPGPEIQLEA